MYSPQEQTFTTRSDRAAAPVTISTASNMQASTPAVIFFHMPLLRLGAGALAAAPSR